MSKLYDHYSKYPKHLWRWPSFTPQEMSCRGDGSLLIDEDAMDKLQTLRDYLGRPLIINSAYRAPWYNRKVGGATHSQHLKAKAFDVSMTNHDPAIFEAAARKVGFTGFGFYRRSNFIHIDTGPAREWNSRWFPRTQTTHYEQTDGVLSEAPERLPEKPSEDKALVGTAVSGAGAVTGAGAVLSGIGGLSPTAQVIALVALAVAVAAAVYVLRDRIRKLV